MGATPPLQLQENEVELVLQSGLFAKSPRLEKFFRYICERHFCGTSDQIKECSIAIEALGRSSDFDSKKDSIVRVEAHRLRKRLDEYYRGPGADHSIHIHIPNGQYRPHFIACEPRQRDPLLVKTAGSGFDSEPLDPAPVVPVVDHILKPSRSWLLPAMITGVLAAALVVVLLLRSAHGKTALNRAAPETWQGTPVNVATLGELRMLAGYHGPSFLDRQGHSWIADAFYKGGISTFIPQSDSQLEKTQRSGRFEYDIPLRQTTYELHLYMTEAEYGPGNPKAGSEATRAFQVSINGQLALKFLDPLTAAGAPNRPYERVLKDVSPGPSGILRLNFDPLTGPAFLNALAILPSPRGRIHPVRIVAQQNPITDSDGRLWAADEYFFGGTAVCRRNVVTNNEDALFHGERYGNFSYRIPLAPGRYRLTLHFAETWFGTPQSHQPALGSRIFNVFANGVALLRNYQVIEDAGGPDREVEKVFQDLEPNAQGLLVIDFVPVENYAEVNALEVVETGDPQSTARLRSP